MTFCGGCSLLCWRGPGCFVLRAAVVRGVGHAATSRLRYARRCNKKYMFSCLSHSTYPSKHTHSIPPRSCHLYHLSSREVSQLPIPLPCVRVSVGLHFSGTVVVPI